MKTVSLVPYSISVHPFGSSEKEELGSFNGSYDLLNEFKMYLDRVRSTAAHDKSIGKLFRLTEFREVGDRTVCGVIESGEYGYEAPLYDVEKEEESHVRATTEAELIPFYFLARMPSSEERGILVLQRFGVNGIKTVLHRGFDVFVRTRHSGYSVDIKRLVPREIVRQYLEKGGLKSITFTKFKVSGDTADSYGMDGSLEEAGRMDVIFKADRGKFISPPRWLREFIEGQRDETEILEAHQDQADRIKLRVKIGGRIRTVNVTNPSQTRASIDVTSEIEEGTNGHPTFESIDASACELMDYVVGQVLKLHA